MGLSNMTLVKIASVGGIITCTMGLFLRSKLTNEIKQADFYKESLKLVRSHKAAVHFLGEPIKDLSIDVGNSEKNYKEEFTSKYEIPVKGTKQKGTVHLWVNKDDEKQWKVNRIEVGLENDPSRRLLVKSTPIQ